MDAFGIHPYGESGRIPPSFAHPNSTPIGIADYRKLVTLLDGATYATKLPKKEADTAEWQAAIESLMLVAELGGPTCSRASASCGP